MDRFRSVYKLMVVSGLLIVLAGGTYFYRMESLRHQWEKIGKDLNHQTELLSSLRSYLGYGGFIHYFKNYVIRGDAKYRDSAIKHYSGFKTDLAELKHLFPDGKNYEDLVAVEKTLEEYFIKLNVLGQEQRKGLDWKSVDKIVKVDDSVAFKALANIHQRIEKNKLHQWQELEASSTLFQKLVFLFFLVFSSIIAFLFITVIKKIRREAELYTHNQKISEFNISKEKLLKQIMALGYSESRSMTDQLEKSLSYIVKSSSLNLKQCAGIFLKEKENFTLAGGYQFDEFMDTECELIDKNLSQGKHEELPNVFDESSEYLLAIDGIPKEGFFYLPLMNNGKILGIVVLFSKNHLNGKPSNIDFYKACSEVLSNLIVSYRREIDLIDQKMKSDKAVKAKAMFLANMSHEIRTPMNAVIGMTEALAEEVQEPKIREDLRVIESSGKHLVEIINDILDFSKLEDEKLIINFEEFSPKNLVQNAIGLFEATCITRNQSVNYETILTENEYFLGDTVRIRQILNNLIGNAVKFGGENSSIHIGLDIINNPPFHRLKFSVRDEGEGIDPDHIPYLFDPFKQEDSSTTRKFGGTGLGLAIAKKLCVLHGGDISVKSEKGKGAEFSFFIDVKECKSIRVEEIVEKNESCELIENINGFSRVLIVEDNLVNQKVLKKALRKFNLKEIKIANDGLEGLRLCREEEFDLIFMDCHMPNLDGWQASKKIREESLNQSTWIVALSASVTPEDVKKCKNFGMNSFIGKPFTKKDLVRLFKTPIDLKKVA